MLLSANQVSEQLGITRTTLWRWCKADTFPQPIKIGPNTTRWRQSEVEEWVAAKAA